MNHRSRWTRPRRAARPRPFVRLMPARPALTSASDMADLAGAVRQWLAVCAR
ncbi:hypothetical protein SAMN05421803_107156 [Nocardiopsis flavescens]|uniref:Uncharacterized protein n=1 Tax=Nocardiopsis flavescens TaxID=758803 RepID=A0A1M6KFM6_9ACTN|nr:hypothetical protein [Nocardiopsis flavescens]SHJ57718.1 hypothetical protein SAMN05421803_107156 [Nocardiopsis flavescens]